MLNSFIIHTLLRTSGASQEAINAVKNDTQCYKVKIEDERKNISAVSLLYQYTNPPPLAYGSPAPKVAESIIRTKQYNSLENGGRNNFHKFLDTQSWKSRTGYPFDIKNPTSNIDAASMKKFATEFCLHNYVHIDNCAKKVLEIARSTNADVLTKGRQTWDPFLQRSVPSPDAFKSMLEFFEKNGCGSNFTMIGWIHAWSSMFQKENVLIKIVEITKKKRKVFNVSKRMFVDANKTLKKTTWKNITGQEKDKYLMTIATEFCSYLKSKERSKLKRRAIASANMILRMFFDVIERFHLELGKYINGSTISKGGIEKRTKIMEGLSTIEAKTYSILATEDATKWNECLAPSGFYIMHYVFFNKEYREKNKIPCSLIVSDYELLEDIFSTGIYLLSLKRIHIGQGHLLSNDTHFTRHLWYNINPEILNSKTKEWYLKIVNDLDNRECVYSPFGMLMGMLNAASTTYGLLPIVKYRESVAAIRSSDDSMTLFSTNNLQSTWELVRMIYARYKLIGINISPKKTRFFRWPYGEYTSWYIDGKFSSQYGVEISTIKPKGDTPHTDFHSSAIETNVSLREFRINNIGAEMMLSLRIANTRRLWRIEKGTKRKNIDDSLILLSDGGSSPWHSTNCHLSEISMKKPKITTNEEKEYFLRIMNIDNPFSTREKEVMTYSKEMGKIVNETIDIPRNVFSYIRRPNKTLKDTFKAKMKSEMDAASLIVELCEKIDPAIALCAPKKGIKCKDYINSCLLQYISIANSTNDVELQDLISSTYDLYKEIFEDEGKNDDSD